MPIGFELPDPPNWLAKKLAAWPEKKPAMIRVSTPRAGMSRVKKIKPGRRTLTAYSCPAMVRMLPRLARRMLGVSFHHRDENLVQRGGGALKPIQRQAALHNLLEQI